MPAKHNALIFAVIPILLWGGLEVSGYTNLPLAIGLWVIAGLLILWWLWHSLPEKPFKRKFMGPLILLGFGVLCTIVGGVWYYVISEHTSSLPPLSIIDPGPGLIRTIRFTGEGNGEKTVYRNVFLLGAQNTSPEQKTIKAVQLKAWLVDTPGNCKITDTDETSIDLNPGDVAYFEIGYLDSRERFYMMKGFKSLNPQEFSRIYHNAGVGVLRLGSGEGDSTLSFMLSQIKKTDEPTGITFQFSGDDMAPLFFRIVVHKDPDHEVRLERLPLKAQGQ